MENIDINLMKLHHDSLVSQTFSLLFFYENQPKETYKRNVQDLYRISLSLDNELFNQNKKYIKYLQLLLSLIDPMPTKDETEHSYVRRRVLDAVNMIDRIFKELEAQNGK